MKKTVEQQNLDILHDTILEALELLRDEAEYWGIDDSYEYENPERMKFSKNTKDP